MELKLEIKANLSFLVPGSCLLLNLDRHIPHPKHQFKHLGISLCPHDHHGVSIVPYDRHDQLILA